MTNYRISMAMHASLLACRKRLAFARLVLPALLLALGLTTFQPMVFSQSCSQSCELAYVECLRGSGESQVPIAICDDRYDACFEACP
jgi:hypothetical protein